jgi:sec-independent protein translocase protein TatC
VEKNQMTFWDHLDELRSRIVKCLWIFFAGFIGAYFLSDKLMSLLTRPLFSQLPPERQHLYYTGLFENFFVHLRVAGCASFLFFSPLFFFILWGFVSPGLHPSERRRVLPFVTAGSIFFLLGAAFAYFVLFPAGVKYFLSYGTSAEVAMLTLESYVSLVLKILIGFGLAFQLPVAIVLLAKIGLITAEQLVAHRRTVIIIITVISALIAPPDAISMLLLMAPLYLLFEGAVVVVRLIQKPKPFPVDTTQS